MKLFLQKICSAACCLILALNTFLAAIPQSQAADDSINIAAVGLQLIGDNDGNNFANIGDVIRVTVDINNADGGCGAQSTQVQANLTAYGGNPNDNVPCVTDNGGAGDVFQLDITLNDASPGGIDVVANNAASAVQVTAQDADENNGAGNPNPTQQSNNLGDGAIDTVASNGVDNQAPVVTDGNITVSISLDQNADGVANVGDQIQVQWDNSGGGDNNTDISSAGADLSAFGGPNPLALTPAANIFTGLYTVSSGNINASNLNASVGATDDAGNEFVAGDSSNLTVNNGGGGGSFRAGHRGSSQASFRDDFSQLSQDCGCDDQVQQVDEELAFLFTQALTTYDPRSPENQCLNSDCLQVTESSNAQYTPAEATYRQLFIDKIESGKAWRKASNNTAEARQAYEQAEGDFQDSRIDIYEAEKEGSSAGTLKKAKAYNANKTVRDEAWDAYQELKTAEHNAQNEYYEADRKFKEADDEADDLIGRESKNKVIREVLGGAAQKAQQDKAEDFCTEVPGAHCLDLSCAQQSIYNFQPYQQALTGLNQCFDDCGKSDELSKAFQDIINNATQEEADGLDSDAGGIIDEGLEGLEVQKIFTLPSHSNSQDPVKIFKAPTVKAESSPVQLPSCGCEEESSNYEWSAVQLLDHMSNSTMGSSCIDFSCTEPYVFADDNDPNLQRYRDAIREKKAAGEEMTRALDLLIKAKKDFEKASANYGNAKLDHYGALTGKSTANPSDTQAQVDKTAQEYRDARAAVRKAEEDDNDSKNRYHQAKIDEEKERKSLESLYGKQAAQDVLRQEYAQKSASTPDHMLPPIVGCFDPVCPQAQLDNHPYRVQFLEAQESFNSCVNSCDLPEQEDFLDAGDVPLPAGPLLPTEPFSQEDFAPFAPLSSQEILRGISFADDISEHPSELFIADLYQAGIIQGVNGERNFQPDQTLTRAAMLKVALQVFNKRVAREVFENPFPDVDMRLWHAPYFQKAKELQIIKGYPNGNVNPAQFVNRAEALAILTRTAGIETGAGRFYESQVTNSTSSLWWHEVWNWAEMNAIVDPTVNTQTDETGNIIDKPDLPTDLITRAQMAEIAVKLKAVAVKGPCNCDDEKKAYLDAEAKALLAEKAAADQAQVATDSESAAKKAESAAKEAQQAVDDLLNFKDDSSSVTNEDGETITTGDLRLLELANKAIHDQWQAGDITASEASDAWKGTNKDKLDELRKQIDDKISDAKAERDKAQTAASDARSQANTDKTKADELQKKAGEARKKADDAKKAYDDCLKQCNIKNAKIAEQRRKAEVARRKKAAQQRREYEARKKAAAAKAARDKAAAEARAARDAAKTSTAAGTSTGAGGDIPAAAKDPCKEKFLQAITARGQQIAKTRPDDIPDAPPALKTGMDFAGAVGEMITGAAQAASQGGSTAASIASGLASLPNIAYGLWVDYVGSVIKDAGTRIINNRRVCNYIKYTASGKCGYETFPPGQIAYYEKGADGSYKVVVMGPGDKVNTGQCK